MKIDHFKDKFVLTYFTKATSRQALKGPIKEVLSIWGNVVVTYFCQFVIQKSGEVSIQIMMLKQH